MHALELIIEAIELSPNGETGLASFVLDSPRTDPAPQDQTITIAGWVLSMEDETPLHIETWAKSRLLKRARINVPRPDVLVPHSATSIGRPIGFHYEIGTLGLGNSIELDTRIVFASAPGGDTRSVDLFRLRARKQSNLQLSPKYNPVQITASGRSGTTLLMQAISLHPEILTTNFYPYEVRQAGYWLHLLQASALPADFEEASHPDRFHQDRQRSGANPYSHPEYLNQYRNPQAFRNYYSSASFNALTRLCIDRIDDYYGLIASEERKPAARLFAEKCLPDHTQNICWDLYPHAREIILTRDFRDLLCSARAFNAKWQKQDFDQNKAGDDFEWVSYMARTRVRHLHEAWQERSSRALHVRYEDLISSPAQEIRRILRYLGVDSSPAISAEIADKAFARHANTAAHSTTANPAASIGRWKTDMSHDLQEHCRAEFGQALKVFGYEP
jgi:hypothetical protein